MFRASRAAFVLLVLIGCGRQPAPETKTPDVPNVAAGVAIAPKLDMPAIPGEPLPPPIDPVLLFGGDANAEKYEAALAEALGHLADQDLPEALVAFETAKGFKDTAFVNDEIAKLKTRIEAESTGKKTLADIQQLLDAGNAAEANALIVTALKVFGGGPEAPKLFQLQAQADALLGVQNKDDPKVRFQRLRDQGNVALQDNNLRVAAQSFQQALQLFDDAGLKDHLLEVTGKLDKYDLFRKRAAEMRRDPNQLDDAVALLKEAAKTWDTAEVRQEIDDCMLALQNRRDTLSVTDFEVVGDVGVPDAGAAIAEDLLPLFKGRFDLVDREQVGKVIDELKLGAGLNNPEQQREIAKLAKVRYLVLGSVRRFGDITVHARLVDASSGLIVQTGKISAPTFAQLLPRLPELSKQLLMTDAEKLAFDQNQLQAAQKVEPVAANQPVPPPPPLPAPVGGQELPQGPVFAAAAPPAFGELRIAQFQALPPPPVNAQPIVVIEPPPVLFRDRLLVAVVQLGDDFFARRQFVEAFRQYEFALSLAPNDFAIRARIEACQPFLPPVPIVIQPILARPRIAILNFYVVGDPRVVPPGLSIAGPEWLAPYFAANFDVANQAEVYWLMARLGLTQADLMNDPNARRWLGRALRVNYFLIGTIQQTASFNVSTYLLNAEQGYLQGSGTIHARNPFEFKMRAGELAQITMLPPGARPQFVAQEPEFNLLLTKGQSCLTGNDFNGSINFFQAALNLRPGNIQVMFFLNQARSRQQQWQLEQVRRTQIQQQQQAQLIAQKRQFELAQAAEFARVKSNQALAAQAEAERRAAAQQRANAYGDLVTRGRGAMQAKNYGLAVSLYQSALDMAPPGAAPLVPWPVPQDALVKELAQARADAARALEQKGAADKLAAQEAALRAEREKELVKVRERLVAEKAKAAEADQARRKVDDAKYQAAVDQGQLLMTQGKYEAAIVAFQGARQIKKTPVVEQLLNTALTRQTEATAKGDIERKQLEEKLAAERERRKKAEAEAKQNRDQYEATLADAQSMLAAKNYDAARAKFQAAGKLFNTPEVASGLKQIDNVRASEIAAAKAQAAKANRSKELLNAGIASLDAGNIADSVQKLEQARKIDPTNVDVLAALSRAEQARDRASVEMKKKSADAERTKAYERFMGLGQAQLAQKDYPAAISFFNQALKAKENDPAATAGLAQAKTESIAAAKMAQEELMKKSLAQKQQAEAAIKLKQDQAAAKIAQEENLKKALALKQQQEAFAKEAAAKLAQEETLKKAMALKQQQETALKEAAAKLAQEEMLKKAAALKQQQEAALKEAAAKEAAAKLAQEENLKKAMALKQQQEAALKEAAAKLAQEEMLKKAAALKQQQEAAFKEAAAKEAAAKLAQEENLKKAMALKQQQEAALNQALGQAQQLAQAKNYEGASRVYQDILKVAPGNPAATQGLQRVQTAMTAAKNEEAANVRYQQLVTQGQALVQQGKFAEAIGPLQEAQRIRPGDPAASLMKQAQAGVANSQAQAAEQKKKASYAAAMQAGQRLAQEKKFGEALQSFQGAKNLYPGDPTANQAIALTTQAWEAQKKAAVPAPQPPPQPKEDPAKAKAAADKAQFDGLMAKGQQLMAQRQFPAAAQTFEAALRIIPNEPNATRLLQLARTAKK